MIDPDNNPSILVVVRRIASHWRCGLGLCLASLGLIAAATWILPNQYQSRVKFLVRNARVNPMVSLDQQTQGVLYVDEVSEARINTEIELMTSTDVLSQVVAQCHLADLVKGSVADPKARANIALYQLQHDLNVAAVRKSDIIEVTYQSRDPRLSAKVVQTLADIYLQAHLRLHGSPGSATFFQQIAAHYLDDLREAEAELAAYHRAHDIIALPEEKTLALQQSTELAKALASSSAQMMYAQKQAAYLKQAAERMPPVIETERRSLPNQSSTEQLALLLVSLRNKRAEAIQRYLPDDRIVKELDNQIAQTETAIASEKTGDAQEVTRGTNPTMLSVQDQLVRSRANYQAGLAETGELDRELKESRARLVALDEATVPYEELERRTQQLKELADLYRKKGDEAQVNDLLDLQRISNVTVAEHPLQAEVPSSPKRGLILSLGFIWSLLIGIAGAFVADLLHERVTTPYELEQIAGLPLLAALPNVALAPSFDGAFPAVYLSMTRVDDNLIGGNNELVRASS